MQTLPILRPHQFVAGETFTSSGAADLDIMHRSELGKPLPDDFTFDLTRSGKCLMSIVQRWR